MLNEILAILAVFASLGVMLLDLHVMIAIALTVLIVLLLPISLRVVSSLGLYPPLLEKKEIVSSDSSYHGEYLDDKFKRVLYANVFIGFFLFFGLIFLLNTLPSLFANIPGSAIMQNMTINISSYSIPIKLSQSNLSTADIAFSLTLFLIPAFLLSLRILANPGRYLFYNRNISVENENKKVNSFKEQIISLYFGFLATTEIILYFAVCFTIMKYNPSAILYIAYSFLPDYTPLAIFIFILIEVICIEILTWGGEEFLRRVPPLIRE
jgi:hypothetical protein